MLNNVILLFNELFSSCLNFTDIVLFLSACCLVAVITAIISYLIKGRY